MTHTTAPGQEARRTQESRLVEETLRNAGFSEVDAYRYNPASLRLRVIDPRFGALTGEQRNALVDTHLGTLPERTQADIISLFTFTPAEVQSIMGSPRGV